MDTLSGKGAVITGGASGIGLATAEVLAGKGAKLVLADVEEAALDAAVQRLRDGGAVGGPVLAMTHDDWRWTIDVDLWGPIHGVEAFLPRIVEQGEGGHILFTASFAGLVPNSGLGPYCVAKYGVVALAEVLYRELRQHQIGVSVLCPMRVGTNIGSSERNRQADYGEAAEASLVLDQDAGNADLAGRVIEVDGVARLTVDAIEQNRLYVLPHEESRESIRRRFERIDRTFEQQPTI